MGDFDVESLLQNGYWPNSRARSLDPRNVLDVPPSTAPRPSRLPRDDAAAPRRAPYYVGLRRPPPPSVEDESDALAKEAGSVVSSVPSEEPLNRGDLNQWPVLQPVEEYMHLHNLERRFVLVSNPSDASSDTSVSGTHRGQRSRSTAPSAEPSPEPASYEANTGRKYGLSSDRTRNDKAAKKKDTRPEADHGRTRPVDLPPIITGGESEARSHDPRAPKPSTTDSRREDLLSPRRLSRERLVAPEIIEHATNGRDRSYYRGRPGSDSQARDRSAPLDGQYDRDLPDSSRNRERDSRSAHSHSPTLHKRRPSEVPKYTRHGSQEIPSSSPRFEEGLSSRSDRKVPSSPHYQSGRDSSSQNTENARAPPPYDDALYSSEDESRPQLRSRGNGAGTRSEKTEYLSMPVEPKGVGRRKSRGQSPSRSPGSSQNTLSVPYSSSSSSRSATFPRESTSSRDENRNGRTPPHDSRPRGSSNATRNTTPATGPATNATATASSSNASADPRRSAVPPSPWAGSIVDSKVQSPIASASVLMQATWPPPKFEPPPGTTSSNPPISSYRRYSAELKAGELPDIPQCPRTQAEAGHMDWLTLPRCDNFHICPSCYDANFASTEFAHDFVLAPFRQSDRPLACDFGTSEFYRIAWLFTRKYRQPNLSLLHGLTKVAGQGQPCMGHREVSRIWYSIRDPKNGRLINEFTVCKACATAVGILLPSLFGLFAPFDSPAEPTRGVCAMHHDRGHDRGRFILYFDALEGAADRALQTRSAPDVQALANRIRELAAIPPCQEGRTVSHAYWHTMRDVPIRVCPECFMLVVQPRLDGSEDHMVAGQFYRDPTLLKSAECMLFSDRMRSVFERAVARRDIPYLQAKVNERIEKKKECDARLEALKRRGSGTPWVEAETEHIVREWKRYE